MVNSPTTEPWAEGSFEWIKQGWIYPPPADPFKVTLKLEHDNLTRFELTRIWAVLDEAGEWVGQIKLVIYSWEWRQIYGPPTRAWDDMYGLGKIWLNGQEHFIGGQENAAFVFQPAKTDQALAEILRLNRWETEPGPPIVPEPGR